MADKTIGDLTQAESIGSEDLFVLQQNSEAKKLKGAQLVKYAQDAVGAQVTAATKAAENAAAAKTGAESAQTQAQAARDAILNMIVEAITLESGLPATVEKSLVDSVYKLTFGLPSGKKGEPGDVGPANTLTIGTVTSGAEASATITGDAPNQVLNLVLKQGDKGNPGDDAPTITNITIRQSDYHMIVTLSDGTSYDAGYCRGASGAGTGDMLADTYDPQGKAQDIFAYADGKASTAESNAKAYTYSKSEIDSKVAGAGKVKTVNSKSPDSSGNIALNASDVGARPSTWTPTKGDIGLGNVDNVKQYSASNPPPYPVTSVNGQTGAVTVQSGSEATSYTATLLSSGWAADGSYQKQTVTVTGLKASYPVSPVVDAQLSGTDADGDAAILTAFAAVNILQTAENQLIAYCIGDAPTTNIPLIINTWG